MGIASIHSILLIYCLCTYAYAVFSHFVNITSQLIVLI